VLEYFPERRHQVAPAQSRDRYSVRLWDIAHVIEPVGMILGFMRIGGIQTASSLIESIGLGLLFVGILIRWTAIYHLGTYFTGTVTIKDDHVLVRSGLYGHVCHPAYTGALLAHLGLGLSFSNWFSLALSSIPYFIAAAYRIHVEEQVLREAFGDEYAAYARQTKRLIPGVY